MLHIRYKRSVQCRISDTVGARTFRCRRENPLRTDCRPVGDAAWCMPHARDEFSQLHCRPSQALLPQPPACLGVLFHTWLGRCCSSCKQHSGPNPHSSQVYPWLARQGHERRGVLSQHRGGSASCTGIAWKTLVPVSVLDGFRPAVSMSAEPPGPTTDQQNGVPASTEEDPAKKAKKVLTCHSLESPLLRHSRLVLEWGADCRRLWVASCLPISTLH